MVQIGSVILLPDSADASLISHDGRAIHLRPDGAIVPPMLGLAGPSVEIDSRGLLGRLDRLRPRSAHYAQKSLPATPAFRRSAPGAVAAGRRSSFRWCRTPATRATDGCNSIGRHQPTASPPIERSDAHSSLSAYRRGEDKYPDGAAHEVSQSVPGKS